MKHYSNINCLVADDRKSIPPQVESREHIVVGVVDMNIKDGIGRQLEYLGMRVTLNRVRDDER